MLEARLNSYSHVPAFYAKIRWSDKRDRTSEFYIFRHGMYTVFILQC